MQGLLEDDEYWPFEGDEWPDEYEEAAVDERICPERWRKCGYDAGRTNRGRAAVKRLWIAISVSAFASIAHMPAPSATRAQHTRASAERTVGIGTERIEEQLHMTDRPSAAANRRASKRTALLDKMLKQRERLVIVRRNEAIKLLVHFVRSEPETAAEMADALLRLAELRWEEARTRYLDQFAAWQAVAPGIARRSRRASIELPLRIYDRIRGMPGLRRYDLVLYMKLIKIDQSHRRSAVGLSPYHRRVSPKPVHPRRTHGVRRKLLHR